jgi:hypothetical protein
LKKSILDKLNEFLTQRERMLFPGWLLVHCLPILLPAWFFTYDGPAHLHNAQLLLEMWQHPDSQLHHWYAINVNNHSNWLYYLIAGPLMLIFSPAWADKIVHCAYLFVFAYGFRLLIATKISHAAPWWSWLTPLFIYNFNFLMGQYNFVLSIALTWWAWSFYSKAISTQNKSYWLKAGVISWLSFLAHPLGFLSIGLFALLEIIFAAQSFKKKGLNALALGSINLLPLLLFGWFTYQQRGATNSYTPFWRLVDELWHGRSLITYVSDQEFYFLLPMLLLMLTGSIANVWQHLRSRPTKILLLASVCFLTLYFVAPEATANASFLNTRLLLVTLCLLFLLSIPVKPMSSWQSKLLLVCLLALVVRTNYYTHKLWGLNKDFSAFTAATVNLKPNAIVQQLNYSNHWMHDHLTEGIFGKGLVHLNNYEASNPYFPLLWKSDNHAIREVWHYAGKWPPCLSNEQLAYMTTGFQPDYLLRWNYAGARSQCDSSLDSWLLQHYTLERESSAEKIEIWSKK